MNVSYLQPVLSAFWEELESLQTHWLGGAGGFSGASFWQVTQDERRYCVRRWPREHPTPSQLRWMHQVLRHVETKQFELAAVPRLNLQGDTVCIYDDYLWEVTPWLGGRADYWLAPSDSKLDAAMEALARFHVAACSLVQTEPQISPGVQQRLSTIHEHLGGLFEQIAAAIQPAIWPEASELARDLLARCRRVAGRVIAELEIGCRCHVPLQPCIRDIWHDHVLFDGDKVSGIVDFGAMRMETIAGDIARLVGSLVADQSDLWRRAIDTYHQIRPLADHQRQLILVMDHSSTVLGPMQWLKWIYLERRQFDQPAVILERLRRMQSRLRTFCATELGDSESIL